MTNYFACLIETRVKKEKPFIGSFRRMFAFLMRVFLIFKTKPIDFDDFMSDIKTY